jgi:hypothetical protein
MNRLHDTSGGTKVSVESQDVHKINRRKDTSGGTKVGVESGDVQKINRRKDTPGGAELSVDSDVIIHESQKLLVTQPTCAPGSPPVPALYTATARNGDNRIGGHWEHQLNLAVGQYEWTQSTGNFDTGEVAFEMTVDLGAGQSFATLTVGTGTPLASSAAGFAQIYRVGLRAEVTRLYTNPNVGLKADWKSWNIVFFDAAGNSYPYSSTSPNSCPPFYAQTPTGTGLGTWHQTRVINPGAADPGVAYPVRLTFNGTIQLSANVPASSLSASQIAAKLYIAVI